MRDDDDEKPQQGDAAEFTNGSHRQSVAEVVVHEPGHEIEGKEQEHSCHRSFKRKEMHGQRGLGEKDADGQRVEERTRGFERLLSQDLNG